VGYRADCPPCHKAQPIHARLELIYLSLGWAFFVLKRRSIFQKYNPLFHLLSIQSPTIAGWAFCFKSTEVKMSVDNELFMQRISEVDYKIRAYARFFSFKSQILEEDDLYQEAMLKLLERYHAEPDFLNSTNSYIYVYAAWMMKNALNHEKNLYVKHIVDLAETEKGDIQLSGHYPRPEDEAIRSEVHSIANQMPIPYQTIYHGTIQGFEPQELACMFGISSGALKWRKRNMVGILKQAWHTPKCDRESIIRRMDEWPSVVNTSLDMVDYSGSMPQLAPLSLLEEELVF
jgi:RNA polymerase sigma factor (sigma-70 family)